MKNKSTVWWGKFNIPQNQTHFWEIGPLFLGIERHPQEWRIASTTSDDPEINDILVNTEQAPKTLPRHLDFQRYVFHETDSHITLTPILADRPQVSRPEIAFYIPSQERATIYVSSPIWVRIEAGKNNTNLTQLPTARLSDTWYGPNTRDGQLCYSSKTFCRTSLDDLPFRPHRVLTPITLHNETKDPLLLEQLSLPLPNLSTFVDINGYLWTEEITVINEIHRHSVHQEKGPPAIATKAKLVSPPRHPVKSMNFMTLLHTLLSE